MSRLKLYLQLIRFYQPTGVYLLLWPCFWGVALAGGNSIGLYLLFALGAFVMRSAGCIVNDIIDRDLDAQVERTKNRPLASGAVSLREALLLLLVLLIVALLIALCMKPVVLILAATSLILVASYPFMKRITWWPQAFLGLTFNWGALMGYAAVKGHLELPAIFLYAGGFFWTLGYDTIYAYQDIADDVKVGIKSTAIRLQHHSKQWIAGFYGAALLGFAIAGASAAINGYFFTGLLCVAAHFIWQVHKLDTKDFVGCRTLFRSNTILGLLVFLALIAEVLA